MKVYNLTGDTIKFYVESKIDNILRTLTSKEKIYVLNPLDSLFIPLRYIPTGELRGNTKVIVNISLLDLENRPIVTDMFFVMKEARIDWDIDVTPSRLYIRHSWQPETIKVSVVNIGTEDVDLLFDFNVPFMRLMVKDTNGKVIKTFVKEFTLSPARDTTFVFTIQMLAGVRNYDLRDWVIYDPFLSEFSARHLLFFRTTLNHAKGKFTTFKGKKIEVIKLPHILRYMPYRGSVIPSILEARAYNILSGNPILSIGLSGNGDVDSNITVGYYANILFPNFFVNFYDVIRSSTLGFFLRYRWITLHLGGAGYGSGQGIGISVLYKNHSGNIFYTRSPHFFTSRLYSWASGIRYSYSGPPVNISTNHIFTRYPNNPILNYYLQSAINASYNNPIIGSLSLSYGLGYSSLPNLGNKVGHMLGFGYGFFIKPIKLANSFNINAQLPYYVFNDKGLRFNIYNNTNLTYFEKVSFTIGTGYLYQNTDYYLINVKNKYRTLTINIASSVKNWKFMIPPLLYTYQRLDSLYGHIIRTAWGLASYSHSEKKMLNFNINCGYTVLTSPILKGTFFLQSSMLFRQSVYRIHLLYSYGLSSLYEIYYYSRFFQRSPQVFQSSFFRQIQFKDPRVFIDIQSYYRYDNKNALHFIGITPTFYYISYSGWRFFIEPQYIINIRKPIPKQFFTPIQIKEQEQPKTSIEHGIFITTGLRKEFGLPIPFKKEKFYEVKFLAFIDLNGDRKKDLNEPPVPDVLIRILPDIGELMTDTNGIALIKYIPSGNYQWTVELIDYVKGFFPFVLDTISINKDTTIHIPLLRAVKVHGKVSLVRERFALGEVPINLSGIRINARSETQNFESYTDKEGNYMLFLPYGDYIISIDESILGMRYFLLNNNIPVKIDETIESLFIPFTIVEKERRTVIKKFPGNSNK